VTRTFVAALLAAALGAAVPAPARAEVPVVIRVIQGSRQGPAKVDSRLDDLRRQLSALAYVRWDQTSEERLDLRTGKTEFVRIPNGEQVGVTLVERRGDTITIEVAITSRNTQSRLTVEKGQRIVHQVTGEKNGTAYFLTVRAAQ
jgi:hypothetical protein